MNAPAEHEENLYATARELTDLAARRNFLDRACAGEPALRARLEGLLAAEAEAERFFTDSLAAFTLPEAVPGIVPGPAASAEAGRERVAIEEPVGARIGRYKLLERLGEGGCGVVYLAEQEEPVRRRVAVKIIKLGMETKSVIARFEAERQALALMDHPNIARVFDAGATERGSPYFVMELVRGVRITDYCDQNLLGTRQRLDLFVQICHAIQHAHQKGVIHRDIKPSNIMIALQDGHPVPKVIDFGIAKATEARLADRPLLTADAQLIGTPTYMSPEQAAMSALDVDTRSDVYSLGVLLYELLTGKTPFDAKELVQAGLDEMRRTLREVEPPRPSARLRVLPRLEVSKAAALRQADPTWLISTLCGDLDWIVMKSLEKDRTRRYETANGLAMDIQRYLSNEPVMARPPSRVYRFGKLVRRNRVVFAAAGAVAAALVVGLGFSTWLFLRERDARHRAVAAEQQESKLRHEAELRARLSQAALLVSQEHFDEADAVLREIALTQPTVEGAAVYRSVGEWHAVHRRWPQAAGCLEKLLKVNQLDGVDVATLDYLRCGPALVGMQDAEGYEQFRQEAIARFVVTPGPFADRIVKVSLLLPGDRRLLDSLRPVAEATAKSLADAENDGDAFKAAWRSVSLALWELRRGNADKAAEWCRRCLAYPESNAPRTATARVILAMACERLGQTAEARAELMAGRETIENKFRSAMDVGTPVQGFWFDWDFARILAHEATALIESTPGR